MTTAHTALRIEGQGRQHVDALAADPALEADVVVLSVQDDGVVRYARGIAARVHAPAPASPLAGGGMTGDVVAELTEYFSDRAYAPGGRFAAQPFDQTRTDRTTLTIDPQQLVASFVLHSWQDARFSVHLHDDGGLLTGSGRPAGTREARATYLVSVGAPRKSGERHG